MAHSKADRTELEQLLRQLRDEPATAQGNQERVLKATYDFLLQTPSGASDGLLHWFCPRADSLVREAATFLLRLFAYDSSRVIKWKAELSRCLRGCPGCAKALQDVKLSSRLTYFGAFANSTLDAFWDRFTEWERDLLLESLTQAGFSSSSSLTLTDVPLAVFYHMLSHPSLYRDPQLHAAFCRLVSSKPLFTSPYPPPVALILALVDENHDIRTWAFQQSRSYPKRSLSSADFSEYHTEALRSLLRSLDASSASGNKDSSIGPQERWSAIHEYMRLLSDDCLTSTPTDLVFDFRRAVREHLHDTDAHFELVLKALISLFRRLGRRFWDHEDASFPQFIFDAVKDNPQYIQLLSRTTTDSWHLAWFSDYLETFWDLPTWGDVLAKTLNLLCGEAQHERFHEVRSTVVAVAADLLERILSRHKKVDIGDRAPALSAAVEIHSDFFVAVAFSRAYEDPQWVTARKAARGLIKTILTSDVEVLNGTAQLLYASSKEDLSSVAVPTIYSRLWKQVYASVSSKDQEAASMMLAVVSPIAHWGTLLPLAVQKVLQQNKLVDRALREVNTGLDSLRSGFGGMITSFAEDNTPAALTTFLQQPGTVKRLIALLMSPKEDYHFAMAVVEQAYDVDGRRDSLRALFDRTPAESYDGVFSSLERITEFISAVPEACTLSKSVVTCLTDIIDALCSKTDGLFHAPGHLARTDGNRSPGSLVSQLWILMSKTSVAIFGRTPKWSRYFEDEREMMTGWMRDAMIFGRDLVSQRRAFATAIISCSGDPNQRVSRTERRLVENLRQFLPSLMMWLRLTDFELLHQAFTLLQSLLSSFEDTGVKPEKDALAKLNEHIQKKQTRLNPSQLAKLEQALCAFDDEDVIIVEKPEMNGRSATSTRPQDVTSSRSATPSIPAKAPDRRNMIVSVRPSAKEQDTKAGPTVKSAKVAGRDSGRTFPTSVPASHASARPTLVGRTSSPSVPPPLVSARPAIKSKSTLRDPRNEGSSKATSEASSEPPSSEASGSEEEDDGPKGLASLAKLQSTPKIKKPDRSRRIMIMDDAATGPGSFHQDRLRRRDDARRTAMRLKPDLSALHRIILEWDYEYTGDQPPQSSSSMKPTHVSDSFRNYESYRRTFESLLLLECWAQLSQSRSEPQDTYTVKITSRQSVDDWIDLEALFADTVPREWALGEADIVLLKKTDTKKYILAKVLSYRSMPHQAQCSLRCRLGLGVTDPGLHISVAWTVKKVFSLTTLHREFGALVGLQYFDFLDTIMQPRLDKLPRFDNGSLTRTMVSYSVNEPQAAAILGALEAEQFCLIQGPPGTGKTTTICALVKACLAKRAQPLAAPSRPEKVAKPKILVCAPSNAAIDEVAARLKDKVEHVIRLGAENSINVRVKDISLDALIDEKMSVTGTGKEALKDVSNQVRDVRAQMDTVKTLRQQKEDELAQVHDNIERSRLLDDEIRKLKQQRTNLSHQMDKLKDRQRDGSRTMDGMRRRFRADVLAEADVICSTLSGAGHELLEQFDSFEMIIIDEAAQAVELSSLIPLKYRSKRCVMVGDPQQLPPTVLSQEAKKYGYDQSLFVRLQKHRPDVVHLLGIQYRMHPEISQLPSEVFYSGRLLDGPDMDTKTRQPWHDSLMFPPYQFFNVQGQESQASRGSSLINRTECQIAAALYNRLRTQFSAVDFDFRIGVVSMYRAQVAELRRLFQDRFGHDITAKVDFNTVDGFQGQEKDIIILSCVRATPGGTTVGFLADTRRMNVALTRARSSLFILGNAPTLQRSDENWKNIVTNAKSRSQFVDATAQYFTQPSTSVVRPAPAKTPAPKRKAPSDTVPADLVAPREVKKVATGRSQVDWAEATPRADPELPQGTHNSTSTSTLASTTALASTSALASATTPAPMDVDEPAASASFMPKAVERVPVPASKPVPKKKAKNPAASLFIPKKRPM